MMFLGNLEKMYLPIMCYCPQVFRAAPPGSKDSCYEIFVVNHTFSGIFKSNHKWLFLLMSQSQGETKTRVLRNK